MHTVFVYTHVVPDAKNAWNQQLLCKVLFYSSGHWLVSSVHVADARMAHAEG